jgi:nucleoside-diphosphate-sugar epimerase
VVATGVATGSDSRVRAQGEVEMWGDGKQTRSFTFIDDCVEGILRITKSDFKEPLNLGSTEMVSMNQMMDLVMGFGDKKLSIKHIPGPEGVRGRNSDNKLILEKLGWEPTVTLADGLKVLTFACKGCALDTCTFKCDTCTDDTCCACTTAL